MLYRRFDREVTAYDDNFEDVPASGPLPMYGGGIVLPSVLIAYGLACWISGHAAIADRYYPLDLNGTKAIAAGIAYLSLGVFLHCHYFWGNLYHLAGFAVLGKILAAIAFIVSLGFVIVRVGVFGK